MSADSLIPFARNHAAVRIFFVSFSLPQRKPTLNHARLTIAATRCHRAYDRAPGRRTWKTWPAARSGKRTRMTRPEARAHLAARRGGDGAGGYGCRRGGPALPPVHKQLHPFPI
jgi:hypothetical protein